MKKDKKNLFSVISLRFWCHAHLYSPVLSIIIIDITNTSKENNTVYSVALSLILISIGSLSFAIFDSIGGLYADRKGCKYAIRYGIWGMIFLMGFFALISFFSHEMGSNYSIILTIIAQALVGIPLSLIDGADTVLTKKITKELSILKKKDEDHLEGFCTRLKYSGIAAASFIGCLIYVSAKYAVANEIWSVSITTIGAFIFLLTICSQFVALVSLNQINESEILDFDAQKSNDNFQLQRNTSAKEQFILAFRAIYSDKVLSLWILIIAVIEGWLLFSINYFQLTALEDLMHNAETLPILIIVIPMIAWMLMQIASSGGAFFTKWLENKSTEEKRACQIRLRKGSALAIPRVRLIAALEIIGIMVIIYIIHLGISAIQPKFLQEDDSTYKYIFSFLPLVFFASYQFLRGFSSPLLKTTLSNLGKSNNFSNLTTTISLAGSIGRLFHAVTTFLFALCLWLITTYKTSETIDQFTQALAATVIVVILALLVLNVLSGVALNRQQTKKVDSNKKTLLEEIISTYYNKSFRLLVIKVSFVVCLVMANVLGPRMSELGTLIFDAGAIPYALTFMLVDVIAEIEGKSSARKLWFSGVFSYFIVGALIITVLMLPVDSQSNDLALIKIQALDTILKNHVLGFLFASLCSFAIAQYVDIWFYTLLKNVLQNKVLWLRSNLTTFISQGIDTVIFVTISIWFMEGKTIRDLPFLIFGFLSVKWLFSLISTPLLLILVWWVEYKKPPPPNPAKNNSLEPAEAVGLI